MRSPKQETTRRRSRRLPVSTPGRCRPCVARMLALFLRQADDILNRQIQ